MSVVAVLIICSALVAADQIIKFFVIDYLKPIQYVDVWENVLRFRYVENSGAVFGSFASHTVILTIVSIVLLGFTIYFLATNKSKSKFINICLVLMVSGGIGNIVDRIRLGYVVDFIEPLFVDFAVFNFADCLITVGAFALIVYLLFDLIRDSKKRTKLNDNGTDHNEDA